MGYHRIQLAASAALINAVTVGFASTYSSTAIENMKTIGNIKPDDNAASWIGSILPLGGILGGVIAGTLADKIGRKGVMLLLSVIDVVGWLLIAYASSLSFIYAGRFLTGVCCGLICVVTPMYVVEICTPEIRGRQGSNFQLFICLGIIISSSTGRALPWNWNAIVGAAIGITALLCLLPIPESPRWLYLKNKYADAIDATEFLYGSVENPLGSSFMQELSRGSSDDTLKLRDILRPKFYKPALLSIGLMFFQQFSGSNAILYYTVSIFKQATTSVDPLLGNILVAIVMSLFTLITSFTMDKLGRKISLYISGFLTCIALNGMSTYLYLSEKNSILKNSYGWIALVCLLVYIAGFSIGLGPIPWLMMSEMSPVRGRGFICGLGTAFSWTFVFIITKTFLKIENLIDTFGAYWLYSGFCLATCFFAFFFLPETKGKSLLDIEIYFSGNQPDEQLLAKDLSPSLNDDAPASEVVNQQNQIIY